MGPCWASQYNSVWTEGVRERKEGGREEGRRGRKEEGRSSITLSRGPVYGDSGYVFLLLFLLSFFQALDQLKKQNPKTTN